MSPISTVDVLSHSTLASATFKFSFSRRISYGVLPARRAVRPVVVVEVLPLLQLHVQVNVTRIG